jgi:tRNA-splicing endonuclease subunit Sen54
MPTLYELNDLFDVYPELPPPVPRKRMAYGGKDDKKDNQDKAKAPANPTPVAAAAVPQSTWEKTLSWIIPSRFRPSSAQQQQPERRPNPFMMLKAGRKMVIVAVVDSGNIGFFRFSQGVFTEWPMV